MSSATKVGCFNVIPNTHTVGGSDSYLLCRETEAHKAGLFNLLGGGLNFGPEPDQDKVVLDCAIREGSEEGGGALVV